MSRLLFVFALCAASAPLSPALSEPASEARQAHEERALEAAAARNAAVNANDIEAFLSAYAPDVRVYQYPDKLLGSGVDRMRMLFEGIFQDEGAAVTVHGQWALGPVVTSRETLTLYGVSEDLISVYTVDGAGRITEVRLIEWKE